MLRKMLMLKLDHSLMQGNFRELRRAGRNANLDIGPVRLQLAPLDIGGVLEEFHRALPQPPLVEGQEPVGDLGELRDARLLVDELEAVQVTQSDGTVQGMGEEGAELGSRPGSVEADAEEGPEDALVAAGGLGRGADGQRGGRLPPTPVQPPNPTALPSPRR